jgi:hypothetical protein
MRDFQIPPPPNPKGQAEMILKGAGLRFLKPKFYKVDTDTMFLEQDQINAAILESHTTDSDSKGKFGLPVFDEIFFEAINYTSNDGKEIKVPNFSMGTALCSVNMTRNIVKTVVAGRNGTVKEYMSDGDYGINIKGVLASLYQNAPPKDSINQLLGFCNCPQEFRVASNFLNYFGIYSIVIESYNFDQSEGQRNVVPFELNCLSDTPPEIKGSRPVAKFI